MKCRKCGAKLSEKDSVKEEPHHDKIFILPPEVNLVFVTDYKCPKCFEISGY